MVHDREVGWVRKQSFLLSSSTGRTTASCIWGRVLSRFFFFLSKPDQTLCKNPPCEKSPCAPTAASRLRASCRGDVKLQLLCQPRQGSSLETEQQMQIAWQQLRALCQHPSNTKLHCLLFPSFLTASVPSFNPLTNYEFHL